MVEIRRLDPLDPSQHNTVDKLSKRILKFARQYSRFDDPEAFTRSFVARAVALDPTVLVLAAFDGIKIVGHCVAEIVDTHDGRVIFVHQTLADKGYTGIVDKLLEFGDTWAKSMQVTKMRTETLPVLHRAEVWSRAYKRYGFTLKSYLMERDVR